MQIDLPPDVKQYVDEQLRSGKYAGVNDLIVRALRVMRRAEETVNGADDDLRRELDEGLRDLEEGNVADWNVEEFKEEIRQFGRKAL